MNLLLAMLLLISVNVMAETIAPVITVKTSAPVTDFVFRQDSIWAGTADGRVLQIDRQGNILSQVTLEPVLNYWGEKVVQRVMGIDVSTDGKTIVLAAESGCLYLIQEGKLSKTGFSTKSVVKKVALVSETRALIALLSNELIFYDFKNNKILSTLSGGTSPLSDMVLSSNRKMAAIAGEAGIVSLVDIDGKKVVKHLQGGNVDNIYKLDWQNNLLITAGQDRRAIVYTLDGKVHRRFDGTFLIYAAALSPAATYAAASLDEQNSITIFDTAKNQKVLTAEGHNATLNRIVFIDEKKFVSCADENKILFWELP